MNTGRTAPASGRAGGIIGGYRPRPEPLRVLSLFAGIGGFDLGLERAGMRVVAQCEIDPFCRKVLGKHWPDVSCHDDITTMEFEEGQADVICGGFPCQDISYQGKGAGLAGARSGLWREMVRAVRMVRPLYVIVENVAALFRRGMGRILGDLAANGYDAEWGCISARAVGAPHLRRRIWIVAHPQSTERYRKRPLACWEQSRFTDCGWWSSEPGMVRVVHGLPGRAQRVRALGNAVVPQVVEQIGRAIIQAHFNHPSHVGTVQEAEGSSHV